MRGQSTFWALCGYGDGGADILLAEVNPTGDIAQVAAHRQGDGPSFACYKEGILYTLSEQPDSACLYSYRVAGGGLIPLKKLTLPGRQLCHLHMGEKALFASCYSGGDIFAVDYALETILWRWAPPPEAEARAHWCQTSPDGTALFAADLGQNCLWRFALREGLPVALPVQLPQEAGSGPRQVLFAGQRRLTVNELNSTLRQDTDAGSTILPATGQKDVQNYPGGALAAADGCLYLCNRGANTVAVFALEAAPRLLAEYPTGDWPRGIAADDEAQHLLVACQRENAVQHCRIEEKRLVQAGTLPLAGAACAVYLGGSE